MCLAFFVLAGLNEYVKRQTAQISLYCHILTSSSLPPSLSPSLRSSPTTRSSSPPTDPGRASSPPPPFTTGWRSGKSLRRRSRCLPLSVSKVLTKMGLQSLPPLSLSPFSSTDRSSPLLSSSLPPSLPVKQELGLESSSSSSSSDELVPVSVTLNRVGPPKKVRGKKVGAGETGRDN